MPLAEPSSYAPFFHFTSATPSSTLIPMSALAFTVTEPSRPMSDTIDPGDVLWLRSAGIDPTNVPLDEVPARVQYARDLQEAGSNKYGNTIVMVMPLKSGNFAAFGVGRDEIKILSSEEISEPMMLTRLSQHFASAAASRTMHVSRLSELGITEPDGRTMARDLRAASRPASRRPSAAGGVEIDLDDI